jgi:hypothetical protein
VQRALTVVWDSALLGTVARGPFLQLLFSYFHVPWYTIMTLLCVDIASISIPIFLLKRTPQPPRTLYNDTKLSSYGTLLSAIFLSLPIYYISAKWLPVVLVSHFDGVRNVLPLPIPLLIALNLPMGYALETLVTRYGAYGTAVALADVFITGTHRLFLGVNVDIEGIAVVQGMWILSILVSISATYIFVVRA